jgi:hypothetical protein
MNQIRSGVRVALLALLLSIFAPSAFSQAMTGLPTSIPAGPTTNIVAGTALYIGNYSDKPFSIEVALNSQHATTQGVYTAYIAGSYDGTYYETKLNASCQVPVTMDGTNTVRAIVTFEKPTYTWLKYVGATSTVTNILTNTVIRVTDGNARKK